MRPAAQSLFNAHPIPGAGLAAPPQPTESKAEVKARPTTSDRTVQSNDGKRRIDIMIHKIGMESPAAAGVPTARGDLLVCQIYTKRISGEFDEAPKEAEMERERPLKIWLARLDNSQVRYPVKLEAQTGFGTIRGRLLSFRERPLTPQESQAMRR